MRKALLLSVLLSSALCACARPIVSIPPARCSSLLPEAWASPVPPEPIPEGATANDWAAAYVGQSGQLEKANGRTEAAIGIFSRCEAMVNAARP